MGRSKASKPRSAITNVRLTEEERTSFDDMAVEHGFANVSEYIRFLHNQHVGASAKATEPEDFRSKFPKRLIRSFHKTHLGEMVWGDSRALLFNTKPARGALARFVPTPVPLLKDRPTTYEIAPPCAVPVDEEATPLFADGGAARPKATSASSGIETEGEGRLRADQPGRKVNSLT